MISPSPQQDKKNATNLPDSHDPLNTARWVAAVADYLYNRGYDTLKQQNWHWEEAVKEINQRSDITMPSNPVSYLRILVRERIYSHIQNGRYRRIRTA